MAELSADRLEEKAKRENPSRYLPKNKIVELQESTDFSLHKAALRDEAIRLDRRDTIRELRAKARRVEAAQQEYASKSSDPLSVEFMTPGGNESVNYFVNDFNDRANELADLENERVSPRDISKYKATQDIINAAKNSGVTLTDDDVENAVKWGVLNAAADRIITAYYAGDEIDARNVLLTLQQDSFVEASLLPEIISDKLIESIEDPTIMESVSNGIMTGLGYAVQPLAAANEYVMQGTRSFLLEGAEQGVRANAFLSFPSQVKAFFNGTDREKVAPGQFDQEYIQEIIDSGNYSDLEIQFSLEVARRASLGDPNAIMSTYTDKYLGIPEAATIAKDLMYSRDNPKVQELFRQIDSANRGNTGQILISLGITPEEYDPARGGETRQDIANITGFAYSLAADPTLLASKAFRLVQATKWALSSLAPGTGSASRVIKQIKLGKLSINSKPYRFFDSFTKDLNKLDELDDAASKATGIEKTRLTAESAALRNAMSRQYDEMPEDLIEDFRRYMPKNDAGKFDVDSAIKYIDESNKAFVLQAGKVSEELALEGASLEAQRALVQSILNEKTFYGRVSSTSQKRTPYVPTMSIAAGVRKGFVNRIISASMPLNKSIKVVDDYISNAADAKVFAKDFSDNALEIGQAVRKEKFTTPGGLYDATGRLFSSINIKPFVSVSTMEDAKSVYRYARSFFPRRTAQLIANAYRNGTEGSRRLLLSGVIRSAAASRGISLTVEEADNWIRGYASTQKGLATGIKRGERYGVTVPSDAMPSDIAARIAFGGQDQGGFVLGEANEVIFNSLARSAKEAGIDINTAVNADDIASKVYQYRAGKLINEVPNIKYSPGANGKILLDLDDDLTYQAYMKAFYPEINDDTVITLYRGLKEGEDVFVTPGTGQAQFTEGFGAYWTTNPIVAKGFGANTKVVSIDVRFGDLKGYQVSRSGNPPNVRIGPSDELWGSEGAVILDYTKVPDSVKASAKDVDVNIPQGASNYYDGLSKLPKRKVDNTNAEGLPGSVRRSLSADSNGIEHALHLDQTASNVALPTIRDFEILRDQISIGIIPTGKWRNTAGTVAQKATDYWSIGTLFGFRFSLRNAIEETGMYWLTGGRIVDFYKGRRASQAIRNVRPRIYVRVDDNKNVVYDKDGVPELIYKSSLGMFANKREWFKRQLTSNKKVDDFFEEWSKHNGFRHWMADLILPATRREDSLIAMQQLARGNPDAFAELAIKSLAAQKRGMNLNAMSKSDEEAYEYLVSSQHGIALLDEIAEASRYLNSGGMPSFIDDVNGIPNEISPGVIYGKPKYVSEKMGDYADIRPVQTDEAGRNVYGASFWWRELQRTIDGDGTIGEVAVKGIKDFGEGKISSAEAKSLIAQAIRDDDTYGYVEKLSRITDDASIDDFANSYFENTLQHFTKADGSINKELVEMFFENGEWAGWWKQLPDGTATTRISKDTLIKKFSDSKDRPAFVFGREIDAVPYIPIAGSMPAFFSVDRAYGWMGAQNARISREPIFISNYFKAYEQTAEAREALAQSMAKSLGREVKDSDYKVANSLYAQQAMDDAFNLTLSYIDNPANRSNLAWKARNISRYYRASEDFYRRLKRMAINSPESFWKAALTYQLTMDSGFVFTDDNGEAYFTYPGNEILQGAVASVAGKFYGVNMKDFSNVDPFLIGGKLLGVAPSSDPMQFIPSFSGPLSAATLTTVFQAFPTLGGLRAATLGPYNQPSGSYIQDLISSVAPAGLTKLYRMTDPEELDSQLAQAGIDTIALMLAEGMLETLSITVDGKKTIIDGNKVTPEVFYKTDQYKASQAISLGLFISKTVIGLFGAAAPRVYSNTVSEEARGLGIDSMKDAQRDLADILIDPRFAEFVEEYSEYSNPYSAALSVWFGMKAGEMIDGKYASSATLLPFTLSSYKTPEDNPILKLSGVRASKELLDWTRTPFAEDLDKNGFGDVRYFLAPKSGEFTWEAWGIAKNTLNLSVTKTEDEKIEELFAMKGKQYDNIIRKEYQDKILAAKSPDEISALKDEMADLRNQNRALNPQWDTVSGSSSIYTESNFRLALRRTRDMLDYIKERDGKLTGDALAIDSAIKIYLEYSAKTSGLTGSTNDVKEYKRNVDAEMQSMFNVVKAESPNAAFFIDSVLQELGFKEIYGETFGER